MVVLIIEVKNFFFALVDPECDPPIPGDGQAPYTLAVAGERMGFPARDVAEFLGVFHLLQEGNDVAYLLDNRRGQAGSIVALNESPQSPVDHVPNLHQKCYQE